jgi:hypothetical protein
MMTVLHYGDQRSIRFGQNQTPVILSPRSLRAKDLSQAILIDSRKTLELGDRRFLIPGH